ncbi:MAG: MbcA/ParS/Xre antitoxin family protein [Solidesulfovibrio sp. DCME]|uniref:MbcA/ParS/Xre antitoxin family protein n=1 Tax=Solidesulfovibrio sp. DCME TaxID=3447380 RepID=UPI003D1465DD
MPATRQAQAPLSRYAASPIVDLSVKADRDRLSPSAVKGFLNIMAKWSVRDADAMGLLGGVSNGRFYAMKKAPDAAGLDQDELQRVSFLVGIFKTLNIIFGEDLADAWVQLPNQNRIFGGATPLTYMIRGGLPAFQTVRRLLDARRGGLA